MNTTTYLNITLADRAARVAAGFALIIFVLTQSGPVGLSALLPLIAIYPILTGFIGWDPLYTVRTKSERYSHPPVNAATAGRA